LTLKATVAWSGTRDLSGGARFRSGVGLALIAIEAASAGVGRGQSGFRSDGKVRRMPLVFRLRDKAVPSLEAEMLRSPSARTRSR